MISPIIIFPIIIYIIIITLIIFPTIFTIIIFFYNNFFCTAPTKSKGFSKLRILKARKTPKQSDSPTMKYSDFREDPRIKNFTIIKNIFRRCHMCVQWHRTHSDKTIFPSYFGGLFSFQFYYSKNIIFSGHHNKISSCLSSYFVYPKGLRINTLFRIFQMFEIRLILTESDEVPLLQKNWR